MLGLTLSTYLLLTAGIGFAESSTNVYLHPSSSPTRLAPEQSGFLLSSHLGLECFESPTSQEDEQWLLGQMDSTHDFVGKGGDALLVSMAEEDGKDAIPSTIQPSIVTSDAFWRQSTSSLLERYLNRAARVYTSIYSSSHPSYTYSLGIPRLLDTWTLTAPTKATETYIQEMSALVDFLETEPQDGERKFGAFDLQGLQLVRREYGAESEQYKSAKETLSAIFQSCLAKPNLNLAVITSPSTSSQGHRRQPPPSQTPMPIPQQPVGSFTRCFQTEDACVNGTSSCSGHGACVQAAKSGGQRGCWVCACAATRSEKGKQEVWAGEMCERKDVSGPFVLLTGTVVVLILLIAGSVGLLFGIDSDKLPSTLTGAVAPGLKRD
ncbi:hypothetical protein GLOTRDRAFT_127446 [Gloeophyllum trabeum ATCC 11539]|uniref:Vacuolar sorting protein Vps3844 C-terminal domain-containing protein n=1 Tax=Gloeophyllum trabeum (strain ATCC 11539 / FP-39264 / Madison 617) TaxID=670483 RepID=S7QEE3_GLOTA|nr:uncharacterized protein GLOTRDRAFT_127446 [Gloeophyllum trabeum ATCC 11539]EPQ57678.1 hypothetical protein GLOTRDRAFT_127446 [Gloeophyllum trabeum ATCC 11539]